MAAEYLLFDLFVAVPLLALRLLRPGWLVGAWAPMVRATLWGALPFVLWDIAVVGRHWWFEPTRVLGPQLLGLPLEELGFFLVVPLACLVTWELVTFGGRPQSVGRNFTWPIVIAAAAATVVAVACGRGYTALVALAIAAAAIVDEACGTAVARSAAGRRHALAVVALTTVFNGYLTARPIVRYAEAEQLGLRIGTVPIEDYGFGLALVWVTTVIYQRARGRRPRPSWPMRWIGARFGGYRHRFTDGGRARASAPAKPVRVAVIGGGLAGLSAAELLARRGFTVELFERGNVLGGKLAAWRERLDDGFEAAVEHGFHAFFRHYYNLDAWLEELGLRGRLRPIPDYAILARDGGRFGFADVATTPGLNLLGLAGQGLFRWREVLRPRTGRALEQLLRYDAACEDETLDATSFAAWADGAGLPPRLRMVFSTFARAFFADEDRVSMAELVRSFHFYYLSHDCGLVYDYLDGSYDEALVDPIARCLADRGVRLHLRRSVGELCPVVGGIEVDGERYDHVVLATDAAACARLLAASPALGPAATPSPSLRAGQRYAVMRLWFDRALGAELPPFVITERVAVLDAIAFVERTDPRARAWRSSHGGSVLELHCYAVPDDLGDDAVAGALRDELCRFVPECVGAQVVHEHLQIRDDFTALHVGMRRDRPTTDSGIERLWFAGDWVRLPVPAMLMEAAHTSARFAVNRICEHEGVQGVPVWTVPLHGLLPARPPQRAETRGSAGGDGRAAEHDLHL